MDEGRAGRLVPRNSATNFKGDHRAQGREGADQDHLPPTSRTRFGGDDGAAELHRRCGSRSTSEERRSGRCLTLVRRMRRQVRQPGGILRALRLQRLPERRRRVSNVVVTAENAVMRAKRRRRTRAVVRKLDHDILDNRQMREQTATRSRPRRLERSQRRDRQARLRPHRDVRSPIDYRAVFEKRKGKWRHADVHRRRLRRAAHSTLSLAYIGPTTGPRCSLLRGPRNPRRR